MDDDVSLRQTLTHLFDAVRYSQNAKELEKAAASAEGDLEADLNKIDSQAEEVANLLSSLKEDPNESMRELSEQVVDFLSTAKEQARTKMAKRAREAIQNSLVAASVERDKAVKSIEAYLASDPLPVLEDSVSVRLVEGVYHARARYECEGGMKYEFGLAAQNSPIFSEEVNLGRLGYEVKVPVRFSRSVLKGRVLGFERLDQYALIDAEASGGKILANFQKEGDGARFKVVSSGTEDHEFISMEYSDKAHSVNVMNDPSLRAHVEIATIKKMMGDLVRELTDLAKKKVALLSLSLGGQQSVRAVNYYEVLQLVFGVLGPKFKAIVKGLPEDASSPGGTELTLKFVRGRLKVLGTLAAPVSQSMGL
ncbi:MAG: hypothetical protein HY296_06305 [Thaumarchaeota archaeon]|nr:hypothetical protein [Nitrososphaerota archaeon]